MERKGSRCVAIVYCSNVNPRSTSAEQRWLIRRQVNRARGNIVQGIAILANECPESSAGASKKRVRRAMLIGSCAPCDSVPRSKLEERSWLVWHEPLSVAIVWALNLTYIEEFFSFARVLRHFVLVPCEICVKKLLLTETIYLSLPTILHYEAPAADFTA